MYQFELKEYRYYHSLRKSQQMLNRRKSSERTSAHNFGVKMQELGNKFSLKKPLAIHSNPNVTTKL